MKPPPFDYYDPATLDDALDLLAELRERAVVLAGGQSLIPLLNLRLAAPEAVVDIRNVGLDTLVTGDEGARLGARARAADVELDPGVGEAVPSLVEALREVGHPQIRNRTTIGGNVAHADPASELPAVLVALQGTITVRSAARGARVVPADAFFDGPFTTTREPDELVTEVWFPRFDGRSTFIEVARRPGDFALVGACVALSLADGVARDVRIGLAGVSGRAIRAHEAEAGLVGREVTAAAVAEAARTTSRSFQPRSDVHASSRYRAALAGVVVERGLNRLLETRP
jgi:carbon-monoxide dehydrogenase medium subunit